MIPEEGDSSGIFLHYTRHPQPKTAGVLLLGTSGFAPKKSTTFFETACQMNDDREIHPFAFRTHTHSLGTISEMNKNNKGLGYNEIENIFLEYTQKDFDITYSRQSCVRLARTKHVSLGSNWKAGSSDATNVLSSCR